MAKEQRFEIVIVGGGAAGISVAAQLRRCGVKSIAVIDPSEQHFYQPLWTLVGAGIFPREKSLRRQIDYIPPGVNWIRDAATGFDPAARIVLTTGSGPVSYGQLVVCPGLEIFWDRIKGLPEALGKDGVCSNYSYQHVEKTWEFIRGFRGGNAIFTMPATPVKCGGAPQKIMYLAEDHFRRTGIRDKAMVTYALAGGVIFAAKKYAASLNKICDQRGIDRLFRHNLVEIRASERKAVFTHMDTKAEVVLPYSLLHVAPPMGAPQFVRESPLANADGWVEVDKATLQHVRYPSVFGLGDASSLPTSKTAAAIRKQAPVVVENLLALRAGKPLPASYNGYTSCPLVTRYGKLILAEFDYDGNPQETFPFDQSKERTSMYLLKKHALAPLYWNRMLRGRA